MKMGATQVFPLPGTMWNSEGRFRGNPPESPCAFPNFPQGFSAGLSLCRLWDTPMKIDGLKKLCKLTSWEKYRIE
jgi:hypothetical protein